jgi:hypothetical protein
MGVRTVRLDADTERTLAQLRKATGLSISEVLKRGIQAYAQGRQLDATLSPYEIYRRIELGAGGWSRAPAADAKRGLQELLKKKHAR